MSEKIYRFLNDNPAARWAALILIALMMFFGYMFVDVMSPLQALVEQQRGWTPDVFGTYASAEYILNVCGFLILAGIILDKMGIRFTGVLSASMMLAGACIKYIGISDWFQTTAFCNWLGSWWTAMPGSAKMAALGFMIFGCGCEMAGTTVSKAIAKWFKGKEMAMAMGIEMAIARVGVFAIFSISPILASKMGGVAGPVGFCTVLLLIGGPLLSLRLSPNTYLMQIKKEETPPYRFAEIIRQSENPTLLNYGFLDGGFYFASGVLPNGPYFCTLNNDLSEMEKSLQDSIQQGKTEFVVTRSKELPHNTPYKLVDQASMVFEGREWKYFLYQVGSRR